MSRSAACASSGRRTPAPARCRCARSSGITSPRMRPLGSAMISFSALSAASGARFHGASPASWPGCQAVGHGSPISAIAHADRADFEPHRRAAGEFELDAFRLVLRPGSPAATGCAPRRCGGSRDRTRSHVGRKTTAAQVRSNDRRAAVRHPAALPAEAVGDQHEAARGPLVGQIAHRDERVLHAGRDHREIVGVLGAQLQHMLSGQPPRSLSMRAPQAASFSSSRS